MEFNDYRNTMGRGARGMKYRTADSRLHSAALWAVGMITTLHQTQHFQSFTRLGARKAINRQTQAWGEGTR